MAEKEKGVWDSLYDDPEPEDEQEVEPKIENKIKIQKPKIVKTKTKKPVITKTKTTKTKTTTNIKKIEDIMDNKTNEIKNIIIDNNKQFMDIIEKLSKNNKNNEEFNKAKSCFLILHNTEKNRRKKDQNLAYLYKYFTTM